MDVSANLPAFSPPGNGMFVHDVTHYPQAVPRMYARALVEHFARGFAEGVKRHAGLLLTLDHQEVNGFIYNQPRFVGVAQGEALSPRAATLLTRTHPEYVERALAAETVFERRPWRDDLRLWDGEVKPRNERCYLDLLALDVHTVSDDELARHVVLCQEELERALYTRGRFSTSSVLPTADFAAHVVEWAGVSPTDALREIRGASGESRGVPPELQALVAAIRVDGAAERTLDTRDAGKALQALQDRSDAVGEAARGYLRRAGYRLVGGCDHGQPYALELPNVLLDCIRSQVNAKPFAAAGAARSFEVLRDRVPDVHRAAYDALAEEARVTTRLRDEAALYCDVWISGVLRRAVVEAGERLVKRGALENAIDVIEATSMEIVGLLVGEPSLDGGAFAARARLRATLNGMGCPPFLGLPPPILPPPPESLPPAMRRGARADEMLLVGMYFDAPPVAVERDGVISGLGVSAGVYEGPARIVREPKELDRLVPGDVLVALVTSPAYTRSFGSIGAVVTDRGGALSHAAITAREHGIPGVVGTRDASKRITDGMRIRVDGTRGEVRMLK